MQSTMISYFIGTCFIVAASALEIGGYTHCGSEDGLVQSIEFTPCDAEPCKLKRGTNVTVSIRFTSTVDTTRLTTSIHGILAIIPIEFTGIPKDACASHDMDQCPIHPRETHVYHTEIPIETFYPLVRVKVEFKLKDDHGVMVCFRVPIEIVD